MANDSPYFGRHTFCSLGLLFICILAPRSVGQTGYKNIHVGSPIGTLPFQCTADDVYCESEYDGQWIRVDPLEGKILTIDVIYSGETLHQQVISNGPITLAQAIKLHSLQPGFALPIFGLAKDVDGVTYGIVDVANDVVYKCSGATAASTVNSVAYLSPDAPVLETAARLKLGSGGSSLLQAARLAKPFTSSNSPIQATGETDDSVPKALTRKEATDGLAERADKVIGSGRMVLALIGQVSNWYEVDKDHPEATAKSEDLRAMNLKFITYWRDLISYGTANKSLLQEQDLESIPFDMKKEIDSKMRQLKAMGFEE